MTSLQIETTRRRSLLGFILYATSAPAAAAPADDSVEAMLVDPGFIRGCVGNDGLDVKVYLESTFTDHYTEIRKDFSYGLRRGTPRRVAFGTFTEIGDKTTCKTAPPLDPAYPMTIYLNFYHTDGRFSSVDVVVRSKAVCKETQLIRGDYPNFCQERTVARYRPPSDPTPAPPPPKETSPRTRKREPLVTPLAWDGSALLAIGGGLASLALATIYYGPDIATFPLVSNAFATNFMSFGAFRRARSDVELGVEKKPFPFIVSGGVMVGLGGAAWIANLIGILSPEITDDQSDDEQHRSETRYFTLSGVGLPTTAIGAGLLAYGVSYRNAKRRALRKRVSAAPQFSRHQIGLSLVAGF